MNRPENILGLSVENTQRIDKFLLATFQWNSEIYVASSKFSLITYDRSIEDSIKKCIEDEGWGDSEILGTCEAGVLIFKYAVKNLEPRLFFYDLLRNRCGYASKITTGPDLIHFKVTHV